MSDRSANRKKIPNKLATSADRLATIRNPPLARSDVNEELTRRRPSIAGSVYVVDRSL